MVPGRRPHFRSLLLCCVISSLIFIALYGNSKRYREWEWWARDQLAKHGRKSEPDGRLLFLAIDDLSVSLDKLHKGEIEQSPALQMMRGGYPYPRAIYPLIAERLVEAGAKVVAFDILTPAEKDGDELFRDAMDRYRDQLILGANLEFQDQGDRVSSARQRLALVPPSFSIIPPTAGGMDPRTGYVNFFPDEDDLVVRRSLYRTTIPLLNDIPPAPEDNEPIYSLSARILQKAGLQARIPDTYTPIPFRFIDEQKVRPYSLYEIFVKDLWNNLPFSKGALFKDKIVLIGPDGNWIKDELPTPFGNTNGPRIHLSALNAALRGDWLHITGNVENVLLIVLGGVAAWSLGRWVQRPLARFLLLVGAGVLYYAASQWAFNLTGLLPVVLSPLLALTTAGGSFSVVEWALDRKEKTRIRRTLERYVSKDVVREVLDNPTSFLNSLRGERRNITVLFSDVRNFTTLTESADEHRLVSQLNEYFQDMVRIVFAHQGRLDKFIGDAVMADWGSITSQGEKEDARCAVATAIQMRYALKHLNEKWQPRDLLRLEFGIGINHGSAIVGNLGCEEKMEVSVIGDAVNTASRLEGVTKSYRVDICISETVAALVRDSFTLRSLDLIVVKGKTKPVEVFTVVDRRDETVAEPKWLSTHEQAMQFYRRGEFADAERCWREVLSQNPGDGVATLFIERCIALQKEPPQAPWTGVWEMKTK